MKDEDERLLDKLDFYEDLIAKSHDNFWLGVGIGVGGLLVKKPILRGVIGAVAAYHLANGYLGVWMQKELYTFRAFAATEVINHGFVVERINNIEDINQITAELAERVIEDKVDNEDQKYFYINRTAGWLGSHIEELWNLRMRMLHEQKKEKEEYYDDQNPS